MVYWIKGRRKMGFDFATPHKPSHVRDTGSVKRAYGTNPFSVLDTNNSDWIGNKNDWKFLDSLSGRKDELVCRTWLSNDIEEPRTSEFDAFLCETMVRWFCPYGGTVLDPFSGGSTRGIVSSFMGCGYHGIDLSEVQIDANRECFGRLSTFKGMDGKELKAPNWYVGDSFELMRGLDVEADMILTCPPYFDLEVYSDDPRDLSNMTWDEFRKRYKEIIRDTCSKLKDNRFAVWVVGDIRDKKTGILRNLTGYTVDCFSECGLGYYNDFVLYTNFHNCGRRAMFNFDRGLRKSSRCHQMVLVFLKGDPNEATKAVMEWPFTPKEAEEHLKSLRFN